MAAVYCCIWEFQIAPDREDAFLQAYGPAGAWVDLFRRDPGYIDTRLLRDPVTPGRYVTIDRWESIEAYRAFHARRFEAYAALDRACADLTRRETCLGEFLEVP